MVMMIIKIYADVVLHITFSQSITKITKTEKIQKPKANRTEMNVKTV